ncbi:MULTISPECIES: RNA polymerase sigma factor [unclassified Pseudoalteromonas]|uniref:RNA polymerase sigma factor n=1 Tax=unclassified Pseudoalteromonas TaxID=194690 RepID=UPI001F47BB95|nr:MULTISPECIES: RNA polymerase sigma factor [unclassified Pseudoalteromonas]MCF2826644.1 RNA polymerase sigma factor [Pseudoalteromonas sp. OF5H-5]MCF2830680.1 RNA polymerase sigma factor [Pseudoalteromonas sp. DL2-H6]MCF2926120.1 RNA polymerase sigma factor [Pseudoalteromonas sp. DL2-H1]
MMYSQEILQSLSSNECALKRFLTSKLGCSDTASDILQIIAEKLLKMKTKRNVENPTAYLYRSAHNEVINYFRTEQARTQYEKAYMTVCIDSQIADISKCHISSCELRCINLALDELPLLTRQIFFMYTIKGVKQRDIATQLAISLSNVEKRLTVAINFCKEVLSR